MREQIEKIINDQVRPYLQSHQGDIDFVDMTDGVVTIRLRGACSGCPSSDLTVRDFIEKTLANEVKGFKKIVLSREVSAELLDMARQILNKSRKGA